MRNRPENPKCLRGAQSIPLKKQHGKAHGAEFSACPVAGPGGAVRRCDEQAEATTARVVLAVLPHSRQALSRGIE